MSNVYVIDRRDDASEMLQQWVKKERGILNRDLISIPAKEDLIESIRDIDFEGVKVAEIYVPVLWEDTERGSPWGSEIAKVIKAEVLNESGVNLIFYFPFSKLQLIDVINDKPDHRLLNGDCGHAEVEEEQCGICPSCIEKFLCYKLNDIPTEDAFMECPLSGHESKQRIYAILAKLSGSTYPGIDRPSKRDISIGALLVECFFRGLLTTEISDTMEKRFQVLLVESSAA